MNSNQKGKRGEREWAAFCRDYGFVNARRGQQYSGIGGEDVVGIPGLHQEVKRTERLNVDEALAQAIRDADGGTIPIVAHRKNAERSEEKKARFYRDWKITLRAEDFLTIWREVLRSREMHEDHRWENLAEGITGGRP